MSDISDSIDTVIKQGLAGLMKANGFARSGRNWHKAEGANWLIVNVQAGSGNLGADGKFTLNLGVYHDAIERLMGSAPPAGRPKEYEATVRRRLGSLVHGHDHWWQIDAQSDLVAIGTDVAGKMQSHGLPWLASNLDAAHISTALKAAPSLVAVCAAWLAEGREEALRRFHILLAERPQARVHFHAWAAKNGIVL